MQISNKYEQFIDTPVLIAVVGKEQGKLYFAQNGILELISAENELSPNYSDREGFFMRAGGGMMYGAGGPYDGNNEPARNRFIQKVVDDLCAAAKAVDVQRVYLFEPEHLKGGITKVLQEKMRTIEVTLVSYGNYVSQHPDKLLEHITKARMTEQESGDPASVQGERKASEKKRLLGKVRFVSG